MLPTGTVTFLFTDIQSSTPLWERDPENMAAALKIHNTVLRQAIEEQDGVVFKVVGDEFQAAFPTALQALRAAVKGQRSLAGANWNELGALKVRMGLHSGEAELDPGGDEYTVSHTKNRAARIMSAAHGGQILLSHETAVLVQRSLPGDIVIKDMGEHRLKGLTLLEQLYQVCVEGLLQDFPPLATSVAHPHNLPQQLTSFIGRDQEIDEVAELLQGERVVTLVGPGGIGKTRLSLRVAEEVVERFHGGVWFVPMAELGEPERVPQAIAAALSLQEAANHSPLEQLIDFLREKRLLIILDNCEHVLQDCARISESLLRACPGLKVLVSSREALQIAGEILYQVSSLPFPDPSDHTGLDSLSGFYAVQLFSERAAAVDPGFAITADNAPAVAQVCRRLDGIPLAIELAAARMSALSVEQIAARLDDRFRLLTGGSRTAVPRQQTLQASIDWSFSLLEDSERLLLMRLSVFQGGWTLELAAEVCGFTPLDEFGVLDGLSQLVNKSLIRPVREAEGLRRYLFLETIRQYAWKKLLSSSTIEMVRNRHLDAFLHLVEAAEPHLRGHQQVEWLDRLETELENLRAALKWALEKKPLKGLRLAVSGFWFWNNRGHRIEGESWLRKLRQGMGERAAVDPVLLVEARARQAHLQMSVGRLGKEVTRIAAEALALAESLGEEGDSVRAIALWVMAISKKQLGQYTWAHKLGRECLEIAVSLGDRFMIAESYETLMDIEPNPTNARHFAEKHLALRRELGDLDGQMIAHLYTAINEFWSGDLAHARRCCEECMEIASTIRNRWGLMEGHSLLGYISRFKGDADRAIEHFNRALATVQDTGESGRVIRGLNMLASAYGTRRDWEEAERHLQQAIHLARSNHFTLWEVISCINFGEVAGMFDLADLAQAHYQAAAKVDRSQEHSFFDGLIAYGNGKAAMQGGDLASAEEFFRQALSVAAETGDRRVMKYSLQALAACAVHSERFERAVRLRSLITSRDWLIWPMSMPWLVPFDLDGLLAPFQSTMGSGEVSRTLVKGQSMTLEQVVAYALELLDD